MLGTCQVLARYLLDVAAVETGERLIGDGVRVDGRLAVIALVLHLIVAVVVALAREHVIVVRAAVLIHRAGDVRAGATSVAGALRSALIDCKTPAADVTASLSFIKALDFTKRY